MKKLLLFMTILIVLTSCSSVRKIECIENQAKGILKQLYVFSMVHYHEHGEFLGSWEFNKSNPQEWNENPNIELRKPDGEILYRYSIETYGEIFYLYAEPIENFVEELSDKPIIMMDQSGTITNTDKKVKVKK